MSNIIKDLFKKEQKFGPISKRINFGESKFDLPLSNLLDIQKKSFENFLKNGIDEAFNDIYPIISKKEKLKIDYIRCRIARPTSEFEAIQQAREKNQNYSAKFNVVLRVTNLETGEVSKLTDVLFGEIPLMTQSGSFVINGAEKVIISQIVRSPGVYFQRHVARVDKGTGGFFNYGKLIPTHGVWIEMLRKINNNEKANPLIELRIDKNRKILLTSVLKALGLEESAIYKFFGKSKFIESSIVKGNDKCGKHSHSNNPDNKETKSTALVHIYEIMRPGDRSTEATREELFAFTFFNKKRYNLGKIGRFTLKNKLSVYERIRDTYLAKDLKDKDDKVLYQSGVKIDAEMAKEIAAKFEDGTLPLTKVPVSKNIYAKFGIENPDLAKRVYVPMVKVKKEKNSKTASIVLGTDPNSDEQHLIIPDLMGIFSYFVNLNDDDGLGFEDDVDSLWNKRVRDCGELLQNQLQLGLIKVKKNTKERMATNDPAKITAKNITNNKPVINAFKTFFNSSQLSQFMDQVNPLSEVSNKRRVTSLGPSGLSRDTAQFDVRDVNSTHYGRICPIETPEGPNIGLILNFATYARLDEYGFIKTPYFKVNKGIVDPTPIYLSAKEETGFVFAQSTIRIDKDNKIIDNHITCRRDGQFIIASAKEINYIDVSSKQFTSIAASCIPFLENDDANRALMGANMQRQAVPLLKASAPIVGTGSEAAIALSGASNTVSEEAGVVSYVDGRVIKIVKNPKNSKTKARNKIYKLRNFERSNQGTLISQRPIVKVGQKIAKGELLCDGPSFDNGELAIGQNMLVAFSTWHGYNYEDAIILSERLVKDDVFTSIHIEDYSIKFRKTKLGEDLLTSDIPNVSAASKRFLDENGIVKIGSEVVANDILVGRVSPKAEENITPEEKLLNAIFLDRSKTLKDTSLKVKQEAGGTVIDVQYLSRENGDKLEDGVEKIVTVFIAQKRKIRVGDKMAGRHGNKGIVSRILPVEDMPHMEDGTPLDVLLNPLGVPSRMNIGQVLEMHLGLLGRALNVKFATPIFDGAKKSQLKEIFESPEMKAKGFSADGRYTLIDGRTGEKFDKPVAVGVMYMLKLSHMVDDKMHARSVGPYSLITQQPLGGKAQNGGQRFGEMEVWALESYGAAKTLQEILTYKSDDIYGRNKLYNAIVKGLPLPKPGVPESFNVLCYELAGMGLKTEIVHENSKIYEFLSDVDEEGNATKSETEIEFDQIENREDLQQQSALITEDLRKELEDE